MTPEALSIPLRAGWSIQAGILTDPAGGTFAADVPVSAEQIAACLGIPEHVTLFFNHGGVVPAAHVVREALQRQEREEERSEVIRLRLSPRERAIIQARAESAGKSVSALIRDELCR